MGYVAPQFRHLAFGHIVSVQRLGYLHQGLVWGFDDYGFPIVASIAERIGFYVESFESFLGDQNNYWHEYPSDCPSGVVLKRALKAGERAYDWKNWNCQHFVRHAHGLKPTSPDADGWGTVLTIGVVAGLAFALSK